MQCLRPFLVAAELENTIVLILLTNTAVVVSPPQSEPQRVLACACCALVAKFLLSVPLFHFGL